MQEGGGHHDEHLLGVRAGEGLRQQQPTGEPDDHRGDQHDDHPNHRDPPRSRDVGDRPRSHETREDVRLSGVAEPPGDQRKDAHRAERLPAIRCERVEQRGVERLEPHHGLARTADQREPERGHHHQGDEHQRALQHIRPGHGEETPEEGVGQHGRSAPEHRFDIGQPEERLEQAAGRHEPGAGVEDEEHENESRRQHPQQTTAILEPALKVIRQGQRITEPLCRLAQRGGDPTPVEPGPDRQSEQQPDGVEPRGVCETRQAHQQPTAHVGGLGAERRHPTTEAAPPEDEIPERAGAAPSQHPEPEADRHVEDHGREGDGGVLHAVS